MKTKPKKKSSKGFKLKEYYESLDLYAWWEQFSLSYGENGQHKYLTVLSFITKKTSDPKKHAFLWWLLGPAGNGEYKPRNPDFATYPQFDWEKKRAQGFWLDNEKVRDIKQAAASRMSSIDEIKATGAFNLDDMGRIKMLCDQLDSEFGGRLQLHNLTAKENDIRLNNYLSLRGKLQSMLHEAQQMFAKTRNIDMAQLAELAGIIGPTLIGQITAKQGDIDPDQQRKLNSYDAALHMMLNKSGDWPIELPTEIKKVLKAPAVIDRKNKVN